MSFIDNHTRKVWVYFMKHKSEMFQHFFNFKAMVEKEKGVSIKCLTFDGGGKYFSNEFSEYLKEHVATLAMGSGPRQGVTRLRAKRETGESLHMLPGVQRVRG
jgi:hypothetical protein